MQEPPSAAVLTASLNLFMFLIVGSMVNDSEYIETMPSETPQEKARRKIAELSPRRAAVRAKYRQENVPRMTFNRLKKRARDKGLSFDLTLEWIEQKLKSRVCEATGIVFSGEKNCPFGISFDRKDNRSGYTMANTWAVCWIYNRSKSDGSHDDVVRFAKALLKAEASKG